MRRNVWCNICNVLNYVCKNNRTTVLQLMPIWQNTKNMGGGTSFCFSTGIWCKNSNAIHLAAIIATSIESVELPLPRNIIHALPVAKMGTSLEMVMSKA